MPKVLGKRKLYTAAFKKEVEDKYCSDWKNDWSFEELSKHYKIPMSTLNLWSKEHNWFDKKKRVRAELYERLDRKQFAGEGLNNDEKLKEITRMRSENAYDTAKMALKLRDLLNDWMMQHDKYKRDERGEIVTDEQDRPIVNTKKALVRELESASKLNQTIYETLYQTLGPEIKEDDPYKVAWALPLEAMEELTYTEILEQEELLAKLKSNYEDLEDDEESEE